MCTYSVCSEFLALRTKSSASMALTKKKKKNKQKNNNKKTKQPPPKKKKKQQQKKKQTKQKNSNKLITKTDKTQQTNVALATARAYKSMLQMCLYSYYSYL